MKKLLYITTFALLLGSCNTEGTEEETSNDGAKDTESAYGGTLNLAIDDKIDAFNPKHIFALTAAQICAQMYSGLLRFDANTLEVKPDIASSWVISDDLLTYTFTLREDVKFQDHQCFEGGKGRSVTAEDFVETFHYYCKNDGRNSPAYIQAFKGTVKGADDYFNGDAARIEGLSAEKNKLVIQLKEPRSTFLFKLANIFTVVLPQEAIDFNGTFAPVGTGPFMLKSMTDDDIVLVKNPNYYEKDEDGVQLPYIDTVNFFYISNSAKQLEMFEDGQLHMIEGLPINKITKVVQENKEDFSSTPPKYFLVNEPEMITQYYEFNVTRKPFDNKKVRQAIAHAINKNRIVQRVLNNQAYEAGNYGLTPPLSTFKGYDFAGIKEASQGYDPEKAKKLLAEAGYPNGKGFPTFKLLFNTGSIHSSVATEVSNQLKNTLNINMEIEGVSFNQKSMDAMFGRSDMVRGAWVADYPSPETFLSIAYGKTVPNNIAEPSHPNTMRYVNEQFDQNFENALKSPNEEESYKFFSEAEKVMMGDAVIIPLWYEERFKLKQAPVRNFETNSLNFIDLRKVYIKEWTEEEYKKFVGSK